ncbi:hypothetical protein [Wolbachia endosymbiont of Oedothorax gibbosus]|uniref:hypothetical protein n=1 Tax=Wolbachia endosymbiont of Oedothorax gibbosus TaxID=931100 RepID=UPI0020253DC1|nr:hypothetical protein [Wolbachia endosymbiont of Oedothorax gibbosus]
MPGSVNENNFTPIPTPRTSTPKKNGEETNPPSPEEAGNAISSAVLGMAGNNTLLIFDFNQTITNGFMCRFFASNGYSDYNSGEENAVTKEKIKEFLQKEGSGIKNEAKLKSVLQFALSSVVKVNIVTSSYPKVVEYVVKNHLGLTEGETQSIKVFEGTTKRQDLQIEDSLDSAEVDEKMTKCQDPQIGKHLCVLSLLKAYKKDKGMLPQKVMLVDGNQRGINPADDFYKSIKEGLLEKDMKGLLENIDQEIAEVDIREEEINNIAFKGVNVSSEPTIGTDGAGDDGYLDKVGKWIKEPIQNLENPVDDGPENHSKKTSKESSDSGIGGQNSEEKDPSKKVGLSGSTPLTPPPSYKSEDGSEKSLSEFDTNSNATLESKKANRSWPRAKYAMQQKGFIIFGATAIILSTSAALLYLQDKAKFIAFFANSPLYTIVPIIAGASLLAISPMFLGIKQFINTEEYQTQGKNADEILAEVLEYQPKDKAIKSVRLEYSNGTHSNFLLNAWEAKNDFINIDEKVVSRTNKIESVINNRPLFTALLTGVVAANVALPLLLYAEGGINNVQKLYQNPLTNNIGLSLLIGSGILALSIICLSVHYYRKTNCTNLIYSQEEIDTKSVNEKFIEEIKRERTNVLGENHSKDAKRISLMLEQVVVQSHNCKDVVYSVSQ